MFLRLTLGAGIFTLPYYVGKFGYIMGLFFILLAGLLSIQSYFEIIDASHESKMNSYFEIIQHYLGDKFVTIFKFTYFLDLSSTPICSMIVIYSLMKLLLGVLKIAKLEWIKDEYKGDWNEDMYEVQLVRAGFFSLFYLVSVPFFLKKNLYFLQKVNFLILISLVLLMVYTIAELPFFGVALNELTTKVPIKKFQINWFENIFALLMAFYAQPFMFTLKEQLLYPTPERMKKTILITMIGEISIFILIGFVGYFCLGDKYTPDFVYQRQPYANKNAISELVFHILMVVFFLCVILGLAIYNPTIRDYFYDIFNFKKDSKITYYLVSLVPFAFFSLFCFLKPDITFVLNISGVTFSNFNGFIIPGLITAKRQYAVGNYFHLTYSLFKLSCLIIFGLIAFFFMIQDILKKNE